MNQIILHHVLPQVFRDRTHTPSDVWQCELAFDRGCKYLIQAQSGTGKSSLCSFIIGQRHDYDGVIEFDGKNIKTLRPAGWTQLRQRTLAYMFQELRLFPELTAMDNILIKNTLTGHEKKKRIRRMMEVLGIGDKENTPVALMSFGQQQRVAFIRALAQPFDFLLIDEPVSHLDDMNVALMSKMATEHCNETGAGLIVTSIGRHLDIPYDKVLNM